jgi:hypothetical protein
MGFAASAAVPASQSAAKSLGLFSLQTVFGSSMHLLLPPV